MSTDAAATDATTLLPTSIRPTHYELVLSPDLDDAIFTGEVGIDLEITAAAHEIVMNSIELEIESAEFAAADSSATVRTPSSIEFDEGEEMVTLRFDGPAIEPGRGRLSMRFKGILNDQLHGFYLSTYQAADGSTKRMATTQFEATDARRCFPCWDEPAIKATFRATLIVPSDLEAVSNTLIENRAPSTYATGRDVVEFKPTPRMSTYLLVFTVADLESIEATGDNGTLVRVWTTAGHAEQGRYALEVSVRLLAYYNEYFGVAYPLEKLDHLAIPDFAAGAMENWGGVTYREIALLFDPVSSSPGTRQRVAEVIAHEMAHMWFGDLVTMKWWNDLWLNESFATWMATKAVDVLEPEWDEWTQFITMDTVSGLNLDGLENSHPIAQEVNNPDEVSQLFDAISYSKGASILRMLEEHLGADAFRDGLRQYMQRHAYANAAGDDLWKALADASGQDIPAMMESWIQQVGFPVVTADVTRSGGTVRAGITQQRFLYSGANQDQTLWHVPVRIGHAGDGHAASLMMTGRSSDTAVPGVERDGWVKVNAGATGFYRVRYTGDDLARLAAGIRRGQMPAPDRLGLLDDTYALSRARLIPATEFLEVASAFEADEDFSVWAALSGHLGGLESLLADTPFVESYRSWGRSLAAKVVQAVGWDPDGDEPHLRSLLRSTVLSQAGSLGEKTVLDEAARRFGQYLEDESSLRPDIRAVVYSLAAEGGDNETFEIIRQRAREATFQEEMIRFQLALSRFQDPGLISRALDLVLSGEVRVQDGPRLLTALASNPRGRKVAWEYMKANWAEFDRRYGGGGFAVMRLVSIPGSFTTDEDRADVERFFSDHPVPSATRTIQQSLERINLNRLWLDANRDGVRDWLAARG
jgi:puromycin-sensitive aminopeptidase